MLKRREIFNCANEVYITFFDARMKKQEEFTIILQTEEEACSFATSLEKLLKEVDLKGHYNTGNMVAIFTDQPKGCGNIRMNEKKFHFNCKEGTNPHAFHEALSKAVWGDTAD